MQHIAEDHFLWEVVDPETGEPVAEGEMGELVLTPLGKQGIPVLRYRTHDLTARRTPSPAPAAAPLARMQKVRSPLRRHAHHPRHQRVPLADRGRARGHRGGHAPLPYRRGDPRRAWTRIIVDDRADAPRPSATPSRRWTPCAPAIAEKLKGALLVGVQRCSLVEPGGIERATGKAKHVDDRREK